MTGHTSWTRLKAKVEVRRRLRAGWEAWIGPSRRWLWVRVPSPKTDEPMRMKTAIIAPDELEVLDEVLAELREEG